MTDQTKIRILAIGIAAALVVAIAALPFAGETLAALTIFGALIGLGVFESRERAF